MSRILWLDDEIDELNEEVSALRAKGHVVQLVDSDERAIMALASDPAPELLIQDLLRPSSRAQVASGLLRPGTNPVELSGWAFYKEVLRPHFPNIPVLICSYDAYLTENLRQADDFNLVLVHKASALHNMATHIQDVLDRQKLVYRVLDSAPQIVSLDFNKVTLNLIHHLSEHPTDLHRVSWANFERLVEILLRELGYEVEHTPLTRDGGADLWALRRTDLGEVLYAIDAKKYAPDTVLPPEPVRAIYGVADMAKASVGMIVTTARFGPAAMKLAEQHRFRISLKDFDGVTQWIRQVAGHER